MRLSASREMLNCAQNDAIPFQCLSPIEFFRLIPRLAAHNETWAIDLLGFGFTEQVTGIPFNRVAIKQHLYSFWKTAINKPVILVGASMRGATAIDFTLRPILCKDALSWNTT